MANAKQVKAGKDYPQFGIKKGDLHWTWAAYGESTQRSLTAPRPSQLIGGHWQEVAAARETIEDLQLSALDSSEAASAIEDAISILEDVQGRYDDATEGPSGEANQSRSETLGTLIDGLQDIQSSLEELETEDEPEEGATEEEKARFESEADDRAAAKQERAAELLGEALALDWDRPE